MKLAAAALSAIGPLRGVYMASREVTEARIREILATERDALILSEKLFHPSGLFASLAATEAERRALIRTPLFQAAQDRLSELQLAEADAFAQETSKLPPPASPRMVQMLDVSPLANDRVA